MVATAATLTRAGGFAASIRWMNGVGVVWIFALTFLICADIFARTVLDSPIHGVPEIVAQSLVACVYLQLAYAIHTNCLTRAELVIERLQARQPFLASRWRVFQCAVGGALLVLLCVGAWPDLHRAWQTAEYAGVEGIFTLPVWPIKLLLFAGSAAAALVLFRDAWTAARGGGAPPAAGARIAFALLPLGLVLLIAALWSAGASPQAIGAAMIGVVLVLIAMGVPIAFALLLAGFVGLGLVKHDWEIATRSLALAAEGTISEYVFATVPLFVLMGLFVNASDIGRDAFKAAQRLFGGILGGLGVATVAANAVFAAITGISIASAAIFTKIAVPEMVRHGYTAKFAVGLTAGSSVLGMLIPPSLLLIVYGVVAEVSIGDLFVAAVVPGVLLAVAFAVGTMVMARWWPAFVGRPQDSGAGESDGGSAFLGMLPVFVLIALVLGGIYGGVFTPTEAGAAGAFGAMCIALLKRRMSWRSLWEVMRQTGQISVTILFLITAASTFSRMLTLTGLPQDIAMFLGGTGLGLAGFLVGYLLLVVALGCVLDSTSIMLILLPLVLPVASELGANLVWFGIITTIAVEIGLLTPPLGLSVYVIKSSLDDQRISLGAIFAGTFPFVLITTAVTILLMIFPELSLMLL